MWRCVNLPAVQWVTEWQNVIPNTYTKVWKCLWIAYDQSVTCYHKLYSARWGQVHGWSCLCIWLHTSRRWVWILSKSEVAKNNIVYCFQWTCITLVTSDCIYNKLRWSTVTIIFDCEMSLKMNRRIRWEVNIHMEFENISCIKYSIFFTKDLCV